MDAGYCNGHVTDEIISANVDFLIGLKGNQKKLLANAKNLLNDYPAVEIDEGLENNSRSRLEIRN